MNKLTNEEQAPTALIKEKIIKYTKYVPWLDMNKKHIKNTVDKLIVNTELIIDDGMTEEMWAELDRIVEEEE